MVAAKKSDANTTAGAYRRDIPLHIQVGGRDEHDGNMVIFSNHSHTAGRIRTGHCALAEGGVLYTQPSEEIRELLRPVYSTNADSLIAVSQVIAINFQTVAAANNYWRDPPL